MKKVVYKHYSNRFWNIGDIEIYEGGVLKEKVNVYYSCDIDKDWIIVYEVGGCHDQRTRGGIIRKIYIGDAEFKRMEFQPLNAGGYSCDGTYYDDNFIEKKMSGYDAQLY